MENKRRLLIPAVIILAFVIVAAFYLTRESALDQRIRELRDEDVDVLVYDNTFSDFATATTAQLGITLEEKLDWTDFKQQVLEAKLEFGSVTVWVDPNEGILWFARSDTAYYYYQVR